MTGPGAGGWCCELFQGLLPGWGAGIFGAKGLADLAAGLAPGAGQAAYGVVSEASLGFALAAQDFLMQVVALYVADELVDGLGVRRMRVALAQVDLVQVAAAVVQVVEGTLHLSLAFRACQGWQHGLGAVAQGVVAVGEAVALAGLCVGGSLCNEVAHQVVFKGGGVQRLQAAIGLHLQFGGREQLVYGVVAVVVMVVGSALLQQAACDVADEFGAQRLAASTASLRCTGRAIAPPRNLGSLACS